MQFQAPLNPARKKSDQVFYRGFTTLTKVNRFAIALEIIKTLSFIILIPVNSLVLDYVFGDLFVAFIINLVASLMGVLHYCLLAVLVYSSVVSYLDIADQAKHAVNQAVYDFSSLENCMSPTVYIADQEISEHDIDQEARKLHQNIAKSTIRAVIKARFPWAKNIDNLYSVLSFASMLYSIFVLATNQLAALDVTLLSLYVVMVGISQLALIIACVAIALSPLICLGLVFYCCCCAKNMERNGFVDLDRREAKESEIANAGGDCAICYMSMAVGEKVYVLPCSDKHVFHCECLRHWAKVKNTCPICRAAIPMASSERGGSAHQGQ